MKSILVVVDMQPTFDGYQKIVHRCKQLIASALRNKDEVIYVEYANLGDTVSELTKESCPYHHFVVKHRMGGGDVVCQKLKELQVTPKEINVCGLYAELCIIETSAEIACIIPTATVNIIKQCVHPFDKPFKWHSFFQPYQKNYPNLKLV